MELDFLVSAAVTLFVVVDPVGLAPSFLAATQGRPAASQRNVARRASLIAALILAGAATGVRTSGFQFTPRRVRATT